MGPQRNIAIGLVTFVRVLALFWITFLTFESMLGLVLDGRGACDYIRPFHFRNLLMCSAVSVAVFEILFTVNGRVRRTPLFGQWLAFVLFVTLIVFLALPLADLIAIRQEIAEGPPIGGDMGYGWYYWDDSGMGGSPVTGFHMMWFLFQPLKLGAFLIGSAVVFVLSCRFLGTGQSKPPVG